MSLNLDRYLLLTSMNGLDPRELDLLGSEQPRPTFGLDDVLSARNEVFLAQDQLSNSVVRRKNTNGPLLQVPEVDSAKFSGFGRHARLRRNFAT
jgi:hypothetical protein